ncbi:MAG: IS630 family transposase [Chloroflexi bacterium]|nr:IS630 family transposase [Chloroflexota bacterium]
MQKRRERAIELLAAGQTPSAVARALSASPSSVLRWRETYQQQGLPGLQAKAIPGRPPALLPAQRERLVAALLRGPRAAGFHTELWTLKRIAHLIRRLFGLRYHPGHVWKILRQLGWSCQKPERRARQRDEAAIAHWKRYVWPQIKKTLSGWAPTWCLPTKAAFCSSLT